MADLPPQPAAKHPTQHSMIAGTGSYLPERIVTNAELADLCNTSDAWIEEHIGIRERRFAARGEGVSDMAEKSARSALVQAGMQSHDLDAIVFATSTPEYVAPGSGVLLQNKLACRDIPAFDVRNTSPGFLYALDMADGLVGTERYRNILVVGAEVNSTGLDFSARGRKMAVIFGDGAGCFILRPAQGTEGFADFVLHADGAFARDLWCAGPSSLRTPRVSAEQIADGSCFPLMNGKLVFDHAVQKMTSALREILQRHQISPADIDCVIAHQANLRILEAVQKELGLPPAKLPHNIEKYGNTSAASIPILFDEEYRAGRIRHGQTILLTSFGSGFCWGAGLLEFTNSCAPR